MQTATEKTVKELTADYVSYAGEFLEGYYLRYPMGIIRMSSRDMFPFQFGVNKARLILAHLEDIKQFVEKHTSQL